MCSSLLILDSASVFTFYCCRADPKFARPIYSALHSSCDLPCWRVVTMFGPVLRPRGTRQDNPKALRRHYPCVDVGSQLQLTPQAPITPGVTFGDQKHPTYIDVFVGNKKTTSVCSQTDKVFLLQLHSLSRVTTQNAACVNQVLASVHSKPTTGFFAPLLPLFLRLDS